jgi:hypothetical protein
MPKCGLVICTVCAEVDGNFKVPCTVIGELVHDAVLLVIALEIFKIVLLFFNLHMKVNAIGIVVESAGFE